MNDTNNSVKSKITYHLYSFYSASMTIFTKIIKGEIPSYKIYEDDKVYAFLDINPVQPWHTLIVPKIEIDHILDVPEPYYSTLWSIAKNMWRAVQQATNSKKVSFLTLWFEVPHTHIHVIPINSESDISPNNKMKLSDKEMKKIQEKIISYL